ncbi:Zn-dependent hydrolase, partial [Burkholderia multivorans]
MRAGRHRPSASRRSAPSVRATPKGGVCRLALTDLDRESRDLFVQWARAAGGTERVDKMGNVFARRAGRRADAA